MIPIKQDTIKKIGGWKLTEETKQRQSLAQKALHKTISPYHKEVLRQFHLGTKLSSETKERMRVSAGYEDTHKNWKGDEVSYTGIHKWVVKWKGTPNCCEQCGTTTAKKFEWANVDHEYRRVLEDYIRMCTPCHRNYDKSRGIKIC